MKLAPDCIGPEVDQAQGRNEARGCAPPGKPALHPEEEKNDQEFAKELMKGVDVYVDDAFAVAHRAHASVEAVTHFAPICVGRLSDAG